jgi:hypothetical protein
MKTTQILALLLFPALSGCAAQLERDITAQARAHCESEGKQFVKTASERSDGLIVSKAQVTGQCVGPGDPGYVAPK